MPSKPEQRNVSIGVSSHTEEYVMGGKYDVSVTTYNNGSSFSKTTTEDSDLHNVSYSRYVKGNMPSHIAGNKSDFVSGQKEVVSGSNYRIVGSPEENAMMYQETADEKQVKIVAMRSQPNTIPDTSTVPTVSNLLQPPPNIANSFKQPTAAEIREGTNIGSNSAGDEPSAGEDIVIGTAKTITDEIAKLATLYTKCITQSAEQLAEITANHIKDAAKAMKEAKKKMYDKMSSSSKEAFDKNMGKSLDNDDAATTTDANKLAEMCKSPSTENLPKIQYFDEDEYKKAVAEEYTKENGILDTERNIC